MKFLSILSFALWTPLLVVVNLTHPAFQAIGSDVGNLPPNLLPEYFALNALCASAGPNASATVLYADGSKIVVYFNQCGHFIFGDELAQMVLFCNSANCYALPNPDCSGGAVPPVPIPFVKGKVYFNAADVYEIAFGQSTTCQPNGLP